MFAEPLSDYFSSRGVKPDFRLTSTALWRGYIGTWEIVNDQLNLIGLEGVLSDGSSASVSSFFPNSPGIVFARWFSGEIRIPQGARLKYVHMGYGSVYERDLILEVRNGVVIASGVINNIECKP